jgi:hypothetical protein
MPGRHGGCNGDGAEDIMSYVNLPPDATFPKLARVLKNQKRLMMFNGAAAFLFAGGLITALASLL